MASSAAAACCAHHTRALPGSARSTGRRANTQTRADLNHRRTALRVSAIAPATRAPGTSPGPPRDFMSFRVKKVLAVPVREFAQVGGNPSEPTSLDQWVKSPANVMGVVFTADLVSEVAKDLWRIRVLEQDLLSWQISPEFDLEILPPEESKRPGGVRMIGRELHFAGEKHTLPPGFAEMPVWTYIDSTLYIDRRPGGRSFVTSDLDITIAADVPSLLRLVPGFQNSGEFAISTSIDIVGAGAEGRVQEAYNRWAASVVTNA